ncbi:MAG TPA: hypothetical protein VN635_08940 [Conexibacter sp.]|nr:hypothetical protein [Conexibacter sp.]
MPRRNLRWILAALVTLGVAFVGLGGPAAAKHFIDGRSIKPGTVGNRQLAGGAVSSSKLSRSLRRAIGKAGPRGATGATGGTGPRGPAGGYRFIDQNGTVIGDAVGYYSGVYPEVLINGVALLYDNDASTPNALSLNTTLYYMQAACAGTAYASTSGILPFDAAIVLQTPASPGSPMFGMIPGTPQSFTAASARTSTGCAPSSTRITNAFAVQAAGTVPSAAKPLRLQAIG